MALEFTQPTDEQAGYADVTKKKKGVPPQLQGALKRRASNQGNGQPNSKKKTESPVAQQDDRVSQFKQMIAQRKGE